MAATVILDTTAKLVYSGAPTTTPTAPTLTTNGVKRLAVLHIVTGNSGTSVSSISGGGTWTRRNNTNGGYEIWTCPLTSTQTGVTLTVTISATRPIVSMILDTYYVVGAGVTPTFDNSNATTFTSGLVVLGNITTIAANTTIAAYLGTSTNAGVASAGAGYSLTSQHAYNSGTAVAAGMVGTSDVVVPGSNVSPEMDITVTAIGNIICISILGTPATIAPPTGVTATYVAGSGINVAWTPPAGYTGTGYRVYRLTTAQSNLRNGVVALEGSPGNYLGSVAWGTNSFMDRELGYPTVSNGDNVAVYYVTTINNLAESALSTVSNSATFLG